MDTFLNWVGLVTCLIIFVLVFGTIFYAVGAYINELIKEARKDNIVTFWVAIALYHWRTTSDDKLFKMFLCRVNAGSTELKQIDDNIKSLKKLKHSIKQRCKVCGVSVPYNQRVHIDFGISEYTCLECHDKKGD